MNIELLYHAFLSSRSISTDTRQIAPGSLFFALKGPRFNANALAAEALMKGASQVIIDEAEYHTGDRTFLVDNVLTALQALARHHRKQLRIPVVALTGSNGKTTTKELIHAVLSQKFKVLATKGNLNNHIGVPLTVLAITDDIEIAVVEMGANHVGEIELLCDITKPTHGLITNIGKAHIGTFGGFENIIKGKTELYRYLMGHNGIPFINFDNPVLAPWAARFDQVVRYPSDDQGFKCEMISADPYVKLRAANGTIVQSQIIGGYNFENMAAALCVGKFFGVPDAMANQAITDYVPQAMRSQVVREGSNLIILDAYNANPSSMEAAIRNLAGMQASHKVAILGDMYELEEESDAEHRKLGALLHELRLDDVYLCGHLVARARETCPSAQYFASRDELMNHLKTHPIGNATILVKASRGMGLEKVMEVWKDHP